MPHEMILFNTVEELHQALEPLKIKNMKVNNQLFSIYRTDDKVYVFEPNCPHMGHPLLEGSVNYLPEVVCPLHHYKFSLKNGEESENRCNSLKIYQTLWNDSGQLILVL